MSLTRSEAVISLGKRLVAQLDTDDDLLGSWMAHWLAELITAAESAPPESRQAAFEACRKAILELWAHRNALPPHLRPLANLEPITHTLASLDVTAPGHHYFPNHLREAATANATGETKTWLDFALGLDYSARLLIASALRSAAALSADSAEAWVKLANAAGAEDFVELRIVRFVIGKERAETEAEREQAVLRDKLHRIEGFIAAANGAADLVRQELEKGKSAPAA